MIVFGGYCFCVGYLNEIWFLDFYLMMWIFLDYNGVFLLLCRGYGVVIIDKSMYIFGGYNGVEYLLDFYVLNVEFMVWEIVDVYGD